MRRGANRSARMLLVIAALAVPATVLGAISTVDLVRVKDGKVEETLYYYENNWKRYREAALERGYIEGYRLLVDVRNPGAETVLLITEYANPAQYAAREENFARVMPADGTPELLNAILPGDFRAVEDLGVFESD